MTATTKSVFNNKRNHHFKISKASFTKRTCQLLFYFVDAGQTILINPNEIEANNIEESIN
jgi:hypothetical protein